MNPSENSGILILTSVSPTSSIRAQNITVFQILFMGPVNEWIANWDHSHKIRLKSDNVELCDYMFTVSMLKL